MINRLICGVKEEKEKLTIYFYSDEEIHIDSVVGLRHLQSMDRIYFKVKSVSTVDNSVWLKVTAEEYGYGSKAGEIDIRDLMKNCFVFNVTDEKILSELKAKSSWL